MIRLRAAILLVFAALLNAQSPDPGLAAEVSKARALADRNTADSLRQALAESDRLLGLARARSDRANQAASLYLGGIVCIRLARFPEAVSRLSEAAEISKTLDDSAALAATLGDLGLAQSRLGRNDEALSTLTLAQKTASTLADRRNLIPILNNTGLVYNDLAQPARARDCFEQALAILRETGGDPRTQGALLSNIGALFYLEGNNQKALDSYLEALALRKGAGDLRGSASTLSKIGLVYSALSMHDRAIQYYEEALTLVRQAGDRHEEADALSHLGEVHRAMGDYPRALEFLNQALALQRDLSKRSSEANDLSNIALVLLDQKQYAAALAHIEQAIAIQESLGTRRTLGSSLVRMSAIFTAEGDAPSAIRHAARALEIARSLGDKRLEVGALVQLTAAHAVLGHWTEALTSADEGIAVVETLRGALGSADMRAGYVANVRRIFELKVDALMQLHRGSPSSGYDAQALETAERSRARSLLDLLAESRAGLRRASDDQPQRAQLVSLETSLAVLGDRLLRLPENDAASRRTIETRISETTARLDQLRAELRTRNPRYAALAEPQPATLAQIRGLLDADTVLLEYSLGEPRSYVWLVTRDSLESFALPGRAAIEEPSRRFHAALSAHRAATGRELASAILGPLARRLEGKRLLVAAEGALDYVPFAALPDPAAPGKLLVDRHEIIGVPSASALFLLRAEAGNRPPPSKTVAIFADPVFSPTDIRIVGRTVGTPNLSGKIPSELERSVKETGLASLDRIGGTRREAEQIAALAPPASTLKALDFDASRERVLSGDLRGYSILHFATHGLLNSRHPELSGLVLSMVGPDGAPRNGFLQAHEIYDLDLSASLVVLSACQTALGKEIAGEGLVGLTRGFMYAGAPRIVASLWKVPDRATSELMRRFYRGMLGAKLTPAAALRQAMLDLKRDPRWASAYYWAAFTLQGEWE